MEEVIKWIQSPDQDLQLDNRGWPKGKLRKWNGTMKVRIKTIREELEDDPEQFYVGPTGVQIEYHRCYHEEDLPPVRTIGKILSDLDMTSKQQKAGTKELPSTSGTRRRRSKRPLWKPTSSAKNTLPAGPNR